MRQTDNQGRVLMVTSHKSLRKAECCDRTLHVNAAWVSAESVANAILQGFIPVQKVDEVWGGDNGEIFCNVHYCQKHTTCRNGCEVTA